MAARHLSWKILLCYAPAVLLASTKLSLAKGRNCLWRLAIFNIYIDLKAKIEYNNRSNIFKKDLIVMKEKTGKLFLIYLAAAVVIASAVRFFQYVSVIDYQTGFFRKGSEPMGNLIYIIFCVAIVGFLGLTFFGNHKKWTAITIASDGMNSKATIFLGASYLVAAVMKLYQLINDGSDGLFKTIAMVAAAGFFAAMGLMFMKSTVPPAISGYLNIFPTLLLFAQSVEFFMDDLVIKNRSDSLILLFIYVTGTLFFASMIRFYGRIETKLARVREIIMAGLAFMFSAVHVIAKLLAILFGGTAVQGMSGISPDAVAIMFVSGTFLAVICTSEQRRAIEYIVEKKEDKDKEKNKK